VNRIRVIPVLLLKNGGLYKTKQFSNPQYVGDPINAVKIFNEKEVDELVLLDYNASLNNRPIDYLKISEIAGEAFMPMAYGGGIRTYDDAMRVFDSGFEKIVLNSVLFSNMSLIESVANHFGNQSVVCSIDYRKKLFGKYSVYSHSGTIDRKTSPSEFAKMLENKGAGEIILNSIERDGCYSGYDIDNILQVSNAVTIPVIACGGASSVDDFSKAINEGHASAVAAGSMFVFQRPHQAVLISYPSQDLQKIISKI
jgi:cyclase